MAARSKERGGNLQQLSEVAEANVRFMAGGVDSEQHRLSAFAEPAREQLHVAHEGLAIAGVAHVDRDLADGPQFFRRDPLLDVHEPAPRHDGESARSAARRPPEGARIRELPSEVEAAGELEQLADRGSLLLELGGERERGARIEEQSHAVPSGARRGEEKDPGWQAWHRPICKPDRTLQPYEPEKRPCGVCI